MNYREFVGQAQHRLELDEMGPTVRVIRAVLTTLGERVDPGEATDLASPLPMEVDRYLIEAAEQGGEKFSFNEFLSRVSERADLSRSTANYYSQTVLGLVADVVPPGNIKKIRNQLPEEFEPIFVFVDEPHPQTRSQ